MTETPEKITLPEKDFEELERLISEDPLENEKLTKLMERPKRWAEEGQDD